MVYRNSQLVKETLGEERLAYHPRFPPLLQSCSLEQEGAPLPVDPGVAPLISHLGAQPLLRFVPAAGGERCSPLAVGVFFSGGQASGGHNVICSLLDALKRFNSRSILYGFIGGPNGLLEQKWVELTLERVAPYRNQGGFDLIGSGRTKIETEEQLAAAAVSVATLNLDGLVIIGGDDSNTNAAFLAEYFAARAIDTTVVGVPKTIDGDLRGAHVEISFGFDTAVKCYSATIGDIARDALSAEKYYFFVKLMGRSASHITLECALNTHPNLALIGEEIAANGSTLKTIVTSICDLVEERYAHGKQYGVILIPEGIVEFIPEVCRLIVELNEGSTPDELTDESYCCYASLPDTIQQQLTLGRDPHGNVQVSKIESERLLIAMVTAELARRNYSGSFNAQPHFCGYEGRCCLPSNFDANYCYTLGVVSAHLIRGKASGYMAAIKGLAKSPEQWQPVAVPIGSMMTFERRKGKKKAVIKKALVTLTEQPFKQFAQERSAWRLQDDYCYPGPIQFYGPEAITETSSYLTRV